MTTSPGAGLVPEWTLGDRLRKARAITGMTVKQFAARIEVSEKTINNAEGERVAVRPITLAAWALASGVDRQWLETGEGSPHGPTGGQPVDPEPRDHDRLAALTARKRARSRSGTVTRAYPMAA